jgi:hypothetical protein
MNRWPGIALTVTAVILLADTQAAAQTTPAGTAAPKPSTPWNAATAQPSPAESAADDSTLSLRVYDGVQSESPLPYRPRQPDDKAYAVDVSAIMSRCADGRLVITALLIGGHLTPLDNRCSADSRRAPGATTPDCDAAAWNCTSKPQK